MKSQAAQKNKVVISENCLLEVIKAQTPRDAWDKHNQDLTVIAMIGRLGLTEGYLSIRSRLLAAMALRDVLTNNLTPADACLTSIKRE